MRTIKGAQEFRSLTGQEIGVSSWTEVTQERIDLFAEATGDHQWIHVDAQRAADGPFGSTIVHGYLTLSLLPPLMSEVFHVPNTKMGINYGLDRVRFPAPLPVNSRIRVRLAVEKVEDVPPSLQVHWLATVEAERVTKPACVARVITRMYF